MMVESIMSIHPQNRNTRRRYDPAFKQDAVDRVLRTGKPIAEVARELGIKPELLARWRREHLADADRKAEPSEGVKPSELAEQLRQARQEVEDLREQRDILEKALSIFNRPPSNEGGS
jgi:transposase